LPALRSKYQEIENASLERMRRPNPLMQEDWGKSKMEVIAEARKARDDVQRKENLLKLLEEFEKEDAVAKELKAEQAAREAAIGNMMDLALL